MKIVYTIVLILCLMVMQPVAAQNLGEYSPSVSGYAGCVIGEDIFGFTYPVVSAQSMSMFIPPDGTTIRFWIQGEEGLGVAPITATGIYESPSVFSVWSPPGTIVRVNSGYGSELVIHDESIYYPDSIPASVSKAAELCPEGNGIPSIVAPVVYESQNILNCKVADFDLSNGRGEAVCHGNALVEPQSAYLEIDGRSTRVTAKHVAGSMCFSWEYQAFGDTHMQLMVKASDGFTYPYPVTKDWDIPVNDADVMLCRYSEDLSTVTPILGDFTEGLIWGLGVNPTDALEQDFLGLNETVYLNTIEYQVPESWVELYWEEGWGK